MGGINPNINLATPQFTPTGLAPQQPLAGGAAPAVGQPGAGQIDVANMTPEQLAATVNQLDQLLKQLQGGEKKKGGGVVDNYLRGNGSFVVKPLEKGVNVKKADDSEYWAALGYN